MSQLSIQTTFKKYFYTGLGLIPFPPTQFFLLLSTPHLQMSKESPKIPSINLRKNIFRNKIT